MKISSGDSGGENMPLPDPLPEPNTGASVGRGSTPDPLDGSEVGSARKMRRLIIKVELLTVSSKVSSSISEVRLSEKPTS